MPRQTQMTFAEGWRNYVHVWRGIYAVIERNATHTLVTNVPFLFIYFFTSIPYNIFDKR